MFSTFGQHILLILIKKTPFLFNAYDLWKMNFTFAASTLPLKINKDWQFAKIAHPYYQDRPKFYHEAIKNSYTDYKPRLTGGREVPSGNF
jgi:hypothetical protein